MSGVIWTPEATALRCPRCHAGPGSRCQTASGTRASAPHRGRLVPSFRCPICDTVDVDPTNVRWGYCSSCHAWTGVPASAEIRAAQDELPL